VVERKSRRKPVFLRLGENKVPSLKTRIYIDGYNLYYGSLRNTPYKWLDILKLFNDKILPSILYRPEANADPVNFQLHPECAIKYFTAKIIEHAARSDDSVSSQAQYYNALKKHSKGRIKFVMGNYAIYKSNQPLIDINEPKRRPRDCTKVQVWKFEEKRSDVNLALQIYDDALSGELDQVVLVTNDTDLVPALDMLKTRCPNIVRGLVIPTRKSGPTNVVERQANKSLTNLAHWVRRYITENELKDSQLPDVVKGDRRASAKPRSWYARPDHLETMISLAKPVLDKEAKIMKWARVENQHLDHQRPIDLIETDAGAEKVFNYIANYTHQHPE
jgi:6-hydroxy-3-succinoylpyridine 3-monooxygenase